MATKKDLERQVVREIIGMFEMPHMEPVEDLIARLSRVREEKTEYINIYVDTDHCWDNVEIYYHGDRLENDYEYDKRLKLIEKVKADKKAAKKKREASDRAEYERLKKKYGE